MNISRPIPIDHFDDLYVHYEPPSEDDLIRSLQGDIDSLTLDLIEHDERIQGLREQQNAKGQPWWTN